MTNEWVFRCDAHHMTEPRKDGLGVGTCIKLALDNAGMTYKVRELIRIRRV